MRSVGPNVELAPLASVSDGLFDLEVLMNASALRVLVPRPVSAGDAVTT